MTAYARDAAVSNLFWRGPRQAAERDAVTRGHFGDAFVFLVPLLLPIEFVVGGRLFLSEVVLVLALPFLLADARRRGVSRISHGLIVLGVLWLFGLVVTDIYQGTPFDDYSRGWSKVAFLLLNYAALSLLIDGRWRRVTLFAAGLVIGQVLQFYFNPGVYATGDPWKFGYGSAFTLAAVLLACHPTIHRRPVVAAGLLITFGLINVNLGFRALAGVCVLTAVTILLAARSAHLLRLDRRMVRTVTILVASILAGFIVVAGYGYAARQGVLGAQARQKYEAQQGKLGLLVGGRPAVIASAHAIRDSPILGHGSWAKDRKYVDVLQWELNKAGYGTRVASSDLIPSHSFFFGAWVEGGILGAAFWLWVLVVAASVLVKLHRLVDRHVALIAFLGFSFLWDVLFSPLGAQGRLIVAFSLVALFLTRSDLRAAKARE